MNNEQARNARPPKAIRVWPGIVAAVLLLIIRFLVPAVTPMMAGDGELFGKAPMVIAFIGGAYAVVAIALWWLLFSRVPWVERFGAIVLAAVAFVATSKIVHESISNAGMGMMLPIYAVPIISLALVAAATISRRSSDRRRQATIGGAILLSAVVFTFVRTGGVTGDFGSDLHWRWTKTDEERLLAEASRAAARSGGDAQLTTQRPTENTEAASGDHHDNDAPTSSAPAATINPDSHKPLLRPAELTPSAHAATSTVAEWPGFRGPNRDGIIRGVEIKTDWTQSPPVQLWRRPIGPGWSSFAVHAGVLYTQEQRGEEEIVAAYNAATGEPVWQHRDPVRFWESNGGAGPRGTPSLAGGRVYAFGATGIVNALNARDGSVVWSRNAGADTSTEIPGWGFASSPLIVDDLVIVAAEGKLVGYDSATGKPRWFGPRHGATYSSPHPVTIDGVPQVMLLTSAGATSVDATDGRLLWEYPWSGFRIVQPAQIAGGDVLIGDADAAGGISVRRIAVAHGAKGWTVEERWTSPGLKPYFNDFVAHNGHAYGFDGGILACIDLEDGKRAWKGGRYGHGQLVLLPDQDVLLVLSEDGDLALVAATADQFKELARFPALDGKTWNHPVLVGDVLYVRNDHEMAAFRLPAAGR